MAVHGGIACAQIPLVTRREAVSERNPIDRPLTFYSLYIPPNTSFHPKELHALVLQLPSQFLLLGHFDVHNQLPGSDWLSTRGRI